MLTEDPNPKRPENEKEWKLIEKVLLSMNSEQRRARRWGIFFKLLTFVYLFALLAIAFSPGFDSGSMTGAGPHTALVNINGVIADEEKASANTIVTGLRSAFEDKQTQAVILRINSPGGSPVQSGYVYDEIKRLRALHEDTKVYAVIADIGASGAYYIAAAADEIYADKASLVGSIGVTSSGFGFVDTLDKLGVERRHYTAGEHKAFLDPFSPRKAEETEFWQSVLNTTHRQFIEQVRNGRGDKLNESPELFSGLIWSGEQALELGLVDGLASPGTVARDIIGHEDIVDFTPRGTALERLTERLGASIGGQIRSLLTESGLQLR